MQNKTNKTEEKLDLNTLLITEDELSKLTGLKILELSGEVTDFYLDKIVIKNSFLADEEKKRNLVKNLYKKELQKNNADFDKEQPSKPQQHIIYAYILGAILFLIVTSLLFVLFVSPDWVSIIIGVIVGLLPPIANYGLYKYHTKKYNQQYLQWQKDKETKKQIIKKNIIGFKNNLFNLKPTRLGVLFDNIDTYNQAIQKSISLISISDLLIEAGNPKTISDEDRNKILETYKILRSDLIRAVKTDKIWRDNPHIKPEDFYISPTPATIRYELGTQAQKYQELVNEAFRIATTIQEQMEAIYHQPLKPKKSQYDIVSKLKKCSLLCSALEKGHLDDITVENIKKSWNKLLPLDLQNQKLEVAIEKRWSNALKIASQNSHVSLFDPKAVFIRRCLCIEIEIFANIASLKEEAHIRLKIVDDVIKRLISAIQNKQDLLKNHYPIEEVQEIEKRWYVAPAAPEPQMSILEKRFQTALQAFYATE